MNRLEPEPGAMRFRDAGPFLAALLALGGCERDMHDQAKLKAYAAAEMFPHRQVAMLPPEGSVPQGAAVTPRPEIMPLVVNEELLARGRERYDIFCSPCHSRVGNGEGMIVLRGFPQPPSYHTDRLRHAPDVHFYDVMTDGFGRMFSYAARIEPDDRWAIVAYIRALQLSQHASQSDIQEANAMPLPQPDGQNEQ